MGTGTSHGISTMRINIAMFVILLVQIINYADRFVFSVLIVPIKAEFELSDTMIGMLTGPAFALLYATLGIPVARLADVGNRRTIIAVSLGVWSAMTVLCGMASNLTQLFLFRMGVGIGEAGATPPSHSLIGSYYPPEKRSFALAFFSLGASFGSLLSLYGGGYLAYTYGWRETLIILGAPGVALAFLSMWLLVEPRPSQKLPPVGEIIKDGIKLAQKLFKKSSYRHTSIGFTLFAFIYFGSGMWDVAFFTRSYDMSVKDVGGPLGWSLVVSGVFGVLFGGWVGTLLAKRNIEWMTRFAAFTVLAAFPFAIAKYMVDDFWVAIVCGALANMCVSGFSAPFYASVHAITSEKDRALAIAILLFILNLVGMAAGPVLTGGLSDFLADYVGEESLRYSLLTVVVLIIPWTALHLYIVSKHVLKDMSAAN